MANARRVIGDTPEHGKHIIYDSAGAQTECDGGLAFAVGVATIEADTARDPGRFWQICHPNSVALYHVMWSVANDGHVAVINIGGAQHDPR